MDSLGSDPGLIVRLLREGGLERGERVIDLACGKGAIAVGAAGRIGCRVVGVDACEEFVDAARELAERRHVEKLVRFRCGDAMGARGRFDAGVMIGWLSLADAARVLRRLVRPGGVYVVDDLVRAEGRVPRGLVGTPTREEAAEMVSALGDEVERVAVPPPGRVERMHARLDAGLRANAAGIGRTRPQMRRALREFLGDQRRAQGVIAGAVRPAVWVVRRGA
jgi:SAM-dependent methyltransferase